VFVVVQYQQEKGEQVLGDTHYEVCLPEMELELNEPGVVASYILAACYACATPLWTGPFDLRHLKDVDLVNA
jgi:hypothetical protein